MLGFDAALFAIAGLAAATGPVLIHLFNRRRYRVVQWAAMDFLKEALTRHRQVLQVRDLIILALRILAVLAFGLALARPFLPRSGFGTFTGGAFLLMLLVAGFSAAASAVLTDRKQQRVSLITAGLSGLSLLGLFLWAARPNPDDPAARTTARSPVHAILVLDNSRSMGVASTSGTRLEQAKSRLDRLIESLPPDSRIHLLTLAGTIEPLPQDPLRSKDDARRLLAKIPLVAQRGDVAAGLEAAARAAQSAPDLPSKRVVVISDLQSEDWQSFEGSAWADRLPNLQIAGVATDPTSNLWIESLELEDGIAGVEAPARFTARLVAEGPRAESAVQAVLTIDGVEVGAQAVELTPGQTRDVEFVHQFDVAGEPGHPHWATATLELRADAAVADQLPEDNTLTMLAPVVSSLPVVFVDQYGDQENVPQNRIGETYALRHLLAPRLASEALPRRLIHVQHLRIDELTPTVLEAARLVVIAGVESPEPAAQLLREYVLQGGPLVVLAGGAFDPSAWNAAGWNEGDGLLPCPLLPTLFGRLPDSTADLAPFFVDFTTLQQDDFQIAGEDPQLLSGLFSATPFFQAAVADVSPPVRAAIRERSLAGLKDELQFVKDYEALQRSNAGNPSSANADAEARYRRYEPTWWQWRSSLPLRDRTRTPEELADLELPRVLAAFDVERHPWMVERRIGAGTSVFFTSGVTSDWNLLRSSGAMYVFHRVLHRLMEGTLPRRNYAAGERITLPLTSWAEPRFFLDRPEGVRDSLAVEALGANVSGLLIRRPLTAGVYRIGAETTAGTDAGGTQPATLLAVSGPVSESKPATLTTSELQDKTRTTSIRVLEADEALEAVGGSSRGQSLWRWCAGLALGALLLEMLILGSVSRRTGGAA